MDGQQQQQIRRLRQLVGFSQERLPDLLHVRQPFIAAIEAGKRPVPTARARQIERLFGLHAPSATEKDLPR
jgi:predicted transcriptional regulator